jgi:N-succinyldiaminopimelate aminotransferase
MTRIAQRIAGFGVTIFSDINRLANEYEAVNLGQGKPDFDGPPDALLAAKEALDLQVRNQYAPGTGIFSLRRAIAEHEAEYYGLSIDPENQVVVTVGATEGIFAAIMGLVNPGDEVIVFEPFYDSYVPNIVMTGATPRYCPLHPPEWAFDADELRALFNQKTRAIIINTPHNPTGKVFSGEELSLIAELCQEYDVLAITDEVYEHLVFDGDEHINLMTLPGMAERTVKIGSLGKTFNLTGWKIGWAVGPVDLVAGVQGARQYTSFAVAHPLQVGAAAALQLPASYFRELVDFYTPKRDFLVKSLEKAGLKPQNPRGGYFVMADFSAVFEGDDVAFAHWLVEEIGVACIPPTFFYSQPNKHIVAQQARFAFCKNNEVLEAAAERLANFKAKVRLSQ